MAFHRWKDHGFVENSFYDFCAMILKKALKSFSQPFKTEENCLNWQTKRTAGEGTSSRFVFFSVEKNFQLKKFKVNEKIYIYLLASFD